MDVVVVNRRTLKIGERIRFANRDAFERSENCFVNRSIAFRACDRNLIARRFANRINRFKLSVGPTFLICQFHRVSLFGIHEAGQDFEGHISTFSLCSSSMPVRQAQVLLITSDTPWMRSSSHVTGTTLL